MDQLLQLQSQFPEFWSKTLSEETSLQSLLLAYSYAKTLSILIPTAIHFGWNLTQNFIFPDRPEGDHIFILAGTPPIVTVSYFIFFLLLINLFKNTTKETNYS